MLQLPDALFGVHPPRRPRLCSPSPEPFPTCIAAGADNLPDGLAQRLAVENNALSPYGLQ